VIESLARGSFFHRSRNLAGRHQRQHVVPAEHRLDRFRCPGRKPIDAEVLAREALQIRPVPLRRHAMPAACRFRQPSLSSSLSAALIANAAVAPSARTFNAASPAM
jgi:hypothetical protein